MDGFLGSASRPRIDRIALALVLVGLAAAYVPSYYDFTVGRYADDAQGHELLLVGIAAWLIHRQRSTIAALPDRSRPFAAVVLLAIGAMLYVFGRGLQFLRVELMSQLFVLASLFVGYKGWAALRPVWFSLLLLLFTIPLPYTLVTMLTAPLKAGVSAASTQLLSMAGYPVGRSGVVMTIGQYDLLVSNACAGLQTMFTLEALGLVYVHLKGYGSALRNALLAVLIVPVSFCANMVRVTALALVTYHFGDDAGRSFIHGFAGLVLFLAALLLIMAVDRALGCALGERRAR